MIDFWKDKERLQRLAGVREQEEVITEDELDGRFNKEAQVVRHVAEVFTQLGIPLTTSHLPVLYDEFPHNAVTVILDAVDGGAPLGLISKLHDSGMADEYFVSPHNVDQLKITFVWKAM